MTDLLTRQEILDIFKKLNIKDATSSTKRLLKRPEGELVWIKNDDYNENDELNKEKPFYKANIIEDDGIMSHLKLATGEECFENKFMQPFSLNNELVMDYSEMADKGIPDMIDIDELNHATILYNLRKRYEKDMIYTYVGPTLLVVNPFKDTEHTYPDKQMLIDYKEIINTDSITYIDVMRRLQPHTYAISAYSHKEMTLNQTRQAIVISGESGSGKTVAAKQCMFFLTSLGSRYQDNQSSIPIGTKILNTNPVLEAFGNSRTARNNNSSRFGKYVKLYFDMFEGKVQGAEIKNYLLEKSRVIGCTEKERNFHIFFFMMRGAGEELAKQLGFLKLDGSRKDFQDFKYLLKCNDLKREDDIESYQELIDAFTNLGFTVEEISAIHRITATCLHLGEIKLNKNTYDDGKNPKPVSILNMPEMEKISKLIGIKDVKGLVTEIVNRGAMRDIKERTPEKPQMVAGCIEALAKALFDNMFNWLVAKMNIEILPEEMKSGDVSDMAKFEQQTKTVGLLDIFGFENFELNQFEQLCINYVNEKLHNLYISSIFGAEKKEMEREGLIVTLVPPSLKVLDVLKLMDNSTEKLGPLGLFQIVKDRSEGGMGNDDMEKKTENMYKYITEKHEKKSEKVFKKIRNSTKFVLMHSAKDVIYDTKFFIERNADSMSESLNQFMIENCDSVVSMIYSIKTGFEAKEEEPEDPKLRKRTTPPPKSIWGNFSIQIQELMTELAEPLIPNDFNPDKAFLDEQKKAKKNEPECEKCDLHFIRCIKPNDVKVPDKFIHAMTLQQITYMGVLESIKVKQDNFPYRKQFEEFYRQYELLSPAYVQGKYTMMSDLEKAKQDWKSLTVEIMDRVFSPLQQEEYSQFYAIGKTKILQMAEIKAVLDAAKQKGSLIFDKQSKMLKRAYKLRLTQNSMSEKHRFILSNQYAMKFEYKRMQKERADIAQKNIQQAITKFKTKKRKSFETDAAEVIEEVYRKHIFRDQLFQALQSRQFMMKGIFDLASINRCRKMWICRKMVTRIADRAFKIIKHKKEQDSVFRIQRILRGHMERNGKEHVVLNAVTAKVMLKQSVSAKKVQKKLRGLIVRRRIHYLENQVSKIQASMRMKWTRRVFLVIKKNVIILQKAYRRYMARRDMIKERLYIYLTQELQVIENVKAMEYTQLYGNLENRNRAQKMGLLKSLTPYSIKKIQFFMRVVDLDILIDLSEIYGHPWSSQWLKAHSESIYSDTPIMNISAGQSHTLIVNSKQKVFVWGWNDNGQCSKPFDINEVTLNEPVIKNAEVNLDHIQNSGAGMRIKQSMAVQDRCSLLIQDTGELVTWGNNEKGQLGLGHYEDVSVPQKNEYFSRLGIKIKYMAAGGDITICCSEDGQGYAWPFVQNSVKQSIPIRMPFSEKTKISKVSCGHNFGFFISYQGLVYSFGEDNSDGQLGLGHTYPTEYPELIHCLRDIGEKIDTIECGFNHSIAKSSLGKIYTWGSSHKGQLGHGHLNSELSPRALIMDKKNNKKCIQIAAGYSHCVIMTENNREIFWFGTCGNLIAETVPIMLDLAKYMPDLFAHQGHLDISEPNDVISASQDFAIVKIMNSWSKTMSVTSMLIADLRAVNQDISYGKLISCLKNLNQSWDPNDLMPPYIETISNMFPANIMRKQQAGGPAAPISSQLRKSKTIGLHGTSSNMGMSRR